MTPWQMQDLGRAAVRGRFESIAPGRGDRAGPCRSGRAMVKRVFPGSCRAGGLEARGGRHPASPARVAKRCGPRRIRESINRRTGCRSHSGLPAGRCSLLAEGQALGRLAPPRAAVVSCGSSRRHPESSRAVSSSSGCRGPVDECQRLLTSGTRVSPTYQTGRRVLTPLSLPTRRRTSRRQMCRVPSSRRLEPPG